VVLVAVQLPALGLYLPPVFKKLPWLAPPQTIISLPVQIAVCVDRALGALAVLVAVQVSSLQAAVGVGVCDQLVATQDSVARNANAAF
jgi:hypothetical protein